MCVCVQGGAVEAAETDKDGETATENTSQRVREELSHKEWQVQARAHTQSQYMRLLLFTQSFIEQSQLVLRKTS